MWMRRLLSGEKIRFIKDEHRNVTDVVIFKCKVCKTADPTLMVNSMWMEKKCCDRCAKRIDAIGRVVA